MGVGVRVTQLPIPELTVTMSLRHRVRMALSWGHGTPWHIPGCFYQGTGAKPHTLGHARTIPGMRPGAGLSRQRPWCFPPWNWFFPAPSLIFPAGFNGI